MLGYHRYMLISNSVSLSATTREGALSLMGGLPHVGLMFWRDPYQGQSAKRACPPPAVLHQELQSHFFYREHSESLNLEEATCPWAHNMLFQIGKKKKKKTIVLFKWGNISGIYHSQNKILQFGKI